MSTGDDRDRAVERLLSTSLRDGLAAESPACVDAEQLAAWTAGALSPAQAASVEVHLATCARCQGMLATLARIEPPAVAAPRRAWAGWWWPAAAGVAAALLVWLYVPGFTGTSQPAATMTMAQRNETKEAQLPAAPADERRETAVPSPAQVVTPSPSSTPTAVSGPSTSVLARDRRDTPATQASEPAPVASAPPPAAPASAKSQAAAGAAPPAGQMLSMPPEPIRAPSPAAPAASRPQESAAAARAASADRAVHVTAEAPLIQAQSGERSFAVNSAQAENLPISRGNFTALAAMVPGNDVRSPGPNPVRWRVFQDGHAERSGDDGQTWTRLDFGADTRLRAAAAPAPTTCWLAGDRGAVFRSTDGVRFTRLAQPSGEDVTAVRATDALHAVVTVAGGRTFATADGGATWQAGTP